MRLNLKLGSKITVATLMMLITVSVISTIVVSVIMQRQNRSMVQEAMGKSTSTLRHTLIEKQYSMMQSANQMIVVNKMGENLNFLAEYSGTGYSSGITQQSFDELIGGLYQTAAAGGLLNVVVYDINNKLLSFAAKKDQEGYRLGFIDGGTLRHLFVATGESLDTTKLEKADEADNKWAAPVYEGKAQQKEMVSFQVHDNYLCIQVEYPVFAETFNAQTEKIEPVYAGMVVTLLRMDMEMAAWIQKLTGLNVAVFAGDNFSAGDMEAYTAINTAEFSSAASGWSLEGGTSRFNTIEISGSGYFETVFPVFNEKGYSGAISLLQPDAMIKANNRQMIMILCFVAVVCMVLVAPVTWFMSKKLVGPVIDMLARVKDIAEGEGDLTKRVTISSKDELGELGKWLNLFLERLQTIIEQVKNNSTKLNTSSTEMAAIAESLAGGAGQAAGEAKNASGASEEMSDNMTSIAAAMEQASVNVNMVATAAEQMSSTINEITQNASKTREVTGEAVEQTDSASAKVGELGGAAQEIGQVIETISDISKQVNLLALNATIEAARAGEAGKGFAVVANEIKELARQTSDASQEIKRRVDAIQSSTSGTVDEISKITGVVKDINENVLAITAAVEEQSATTQNISENVSQAAQGITDVNVHIANNSEVSTQIAEQIGLVTESANDISESSSKVNTGSKDLSDLAEQLDNLVGRFKV